MHRLFYHLLRLIVLSTLFGVNLFSQETDTVYDFKIQSSAYRLLGKPVPNFTAVNLSHDTINASKLKGHITLMQFIYFGCAPCLREVTVLNMLHEKYHNTGLKIYAVIPNRPVDIEAFQDPCDTTDFNIFSHSRKFFKYDRINYDVIPECPGNDIITDRNSIRIDCKPVSLIFMRDSYPTGYLIDRNGIIRKVFVGFESTKMDEETRKLEDNIVELLNEP